MSGPLLMAEVDGRVLPLASCDWILWGPCGCPFGLVVASYAPTEEAAWKSLYDRKRDSDRAQRKGNRLELNDPRPVQPRRVPADAQALPAHRPAGTAGGDVMTAASAATSHPSRFIRTPALFTRDLLLFLLLLGALYAGLLTVQTSRMNTASRACTTPGWSFSGTRVYGIPAGWTCAPPLPGPPAAPAGPRDA